MLSANETIARMLEELAEREALRGTDYKPRAYRRAARNVRGLDRSVIELRDEGRLGEIEGVGDAIEAKIEEALDTGRIAALERAREEVPVDVATLGKVKGLGTKKLGTLWQELDVTTLDELETAARDGQVGQLAGFGPKTVETILGQIDRVREAANRWRLDELEQAADALVDRLTGEGLVDEVEPAGALRRRCPWGEALTLVATAGDPDAVLDAFCKVPEAAEVLDRDDRKASLRLVTGTPATLVLAPHDAYGATLAEHTGAKAHVDALRENAYARDYTWDVEGLADASGDPIPTPTEETLYQELEVPLAPPELREGLGETEPGTPLPDLVTLDDVRGDLQMHTTYSDGATSVLAMAEKADRLGYDYLLVTDHGPSLTVAGAPSVDELHEQRDEIARVNEDDTVDARILWGVEANVTADGIDVPPDVCEAMDLVVASLHDTVEDASQRVVRALEDYAVDVLGHPTNRLINEREGNTLDMEAIVDAATANDVALEINAQPKRLDLDWREARRVKDEVGFVISTDAHAPAEMEVMRYGVEQARKAGLEPDDVLNTQPLDELLEGLGRA